MFYLVVKHILPGMGLFFYFVLHFNCKFATMIKEMVPMTIVGQLVGENGGRAVQFDWQPIAGGNVELQRALAFLNKVSLETEV